jgi:hypothetical protein
MRRKIDYSKMGHLVSARATYTLAETEFLLHGVDMVERLRRAKKLIPCVDENRIVLFAKKDVQACQDELLDGALPLPLSHYREKSAAI